MNLNKNVSSWAVVKAEAVMTMSPAAIKNILTMALEDIQRLGAAMSPYCPKCGRIHGVKEWCGPKAPDGCECRDAGTSLLCPLHNNLPLQPQT